MDEDKDRRTKKRYFRYKLRIIDSTFWMLKWPLRAKISQSAIISFANVYLIASTQFYLGYIFKVFCSLNMGFHSIMKDYHANNFSNLLFPNRS